jgi:hypothetical protein
MEKVQKEKTNASERLAASALWVSDKGLIGKNVEGSGHYQFKVQF